MSTTHLIVIIQIAIVTFIEIVCIITDIILIKKDIDHYNHDLLPCVIVPTIVQVLAAVYFISESIKGNL